MKLLRNSDLGDYVNALSDIKLSLYMDIMKEFVVMCGIRLLHLIG